MRRILSMVVLHALGLAALSAVALLGLYGRDGTWALLFGRPDLGRVDVATLARDPDGGDALVCRRGLCAAAADAEAPVFAVPAEELRRRLRAVVAADPLVARVADYGEALEERYVARSRILRFPDTVNVRYIALTRDQSTVALHSRSQIGPADRGANLSRLVSWVERLRGEVPRAE